MAMNDLISDMLTRVRNAQSANLKTVEIIPSKINIEIAKILKEEGYVNEFELIDGKTGHKMLKIKLKYDKNEKPAIRYIKRVSKPGRRVYVKSADIKSTLNGLGISIITTSKGVITGRKARELKVGGEIVCEVW